MKIGALIVTTGLSPISGVAALMPKIGTISAGQRMISAFRRVNVSVVGLVVGPADKKEERTFSQNGVLFFHCADKRATFFQGIQQGLQFMADKFDRVFLVPGDMPLFLPNTLERLLRSTASIAVPENACANGYPVLLDRQAMKLILAERTARDADQAIRKSGLAVDMISVEDPGVLLRSEIAPQQQDLIQIHNRQLTRPVAQFTLTKGGDLYDARLSMLLHLVDETRSVRDACEMMQISYSTAWNMLNHVEEELGYPLVTRIRGGSTGSGSVLTQKGRKLMESYDAFSAHLEQTAQELYQKYFSSLRS